MRWGSRCAQQQELQVLGSVPVCTARKALLLGSLPAPRLRNSHKPCFQGLQKAGKNSCRFCPLGLRDGARLGGPWTGRLELGTLWLPVCPLCPGLLMFHFQIWQISLGVEGLVAVSGTDRERAGERSRARQGWTQSSSLLSSPPFPFPSSFFQPPPLLFPPSLQLPRASA